MKKIIIVTGGAGFIGVNLIKKLLIKTTFNIVSIDNYSAGTKKNHIKNKRIKYIKADTRNIKKILNYCKKDIHSLFHFGEFSRIYQSFLKSNDCFKYNTIGSYEVFDFCLNNKIKLIYSATSASLGNNGQDKNLSPYSFSKAKNLEFLENLKKWFNFKYEIIYFYNVYGNNQIGTGNMATVIGIFENQYKNKKPLTVVKPGNQSRRFTHIEDTIKVCYLAWKQNKCRHYAISNKKSYTILEVAKLFGGKIKLLASRKGERNLSELVNANLSNKVYKLYGKIELKQYILNFIKNIR